MTLTTALQNLQPGETLHVCKYLTVKAVHMQGRTWYLTSFQGRAAVRDLASLAQDYGHIQIAEIRRGTPPADGDA